MDKLGFIYIAIFMTSLPTRYQYTCIYVKNVHWVLVFIYERFED